MLCAQVIPELRPEDLEKGRLREVCLIGNLPSSYLLKPIADHVSGPGEGQLTGPVAANVDSAPLQPLTGWVLWDFCDKGTLVVS